MIGLERPAMAALIPGVLGLLWWFHRARRAPRPRVVSSLLLWRRVAAEIAAASHRRMPGLLLLLECFAGTALVLAAAGPFRVRERPAAPAVSILVDRRPAMGATGSGGRSRLAEGTEALLTWLEPLPAGTRVRVAAVPPTTDGTREFTAGEAALGAWLRDLQPAARGDDLEAAVGVLSSLPGQRLVVTDSGRPTGPWARGVEWLGVGAPGTNAGLVWARVPAAAAGDLRLDVGVLNGGTRAISRPLVLEIGSTRSTLATVNLAPGEVWSGDAIPLPPGAAGRMGVIRLAGRDDLAADDAVVLRPRPAREVRLVAEEAVPAAVQRVVQALGAETVLVAPGAAPPGGPAVYWKVFPPAATSAPLVLVTREGSWGGIRFGPVYRPVALARGDGWSEVGGRAPYPDAVTEAFAADSDDTWIVDLLGRDAAGAAHPVVLRRAGANVLAFDPVRDAPGWPEEDSFPAFFYRALGQAGERFAAEGLLSAADTTLGTDTSRPPPPAGDRGAAGSFSRESLAGWLVMLALIALLGIYRLEV